MSKRRSPETTDKDTRHFKKQKLGINKELRINHMDNFGSDEETQNHHSFKNYSFQSRRTTKKRKNFIDHNKRTTEHWENDPNEVKLKPRPRPKKLIDKRPKKEINTNNNDNKNKETWNEKESWSRAEYEIDRDWYLTDRDEEDPDGTKYFGGKDTSFLTRRQKIELMKQKESEKIEKRQNPKLTQLQKDQGKWEEELLNRSGIVNKVNKSALLFEEEVEHRTRVLTRDIKPPFLSSNKQYSTQLTDVKIVKDPTSDMAVIAKKGSHVLNEWRKNRDKKKFKKKWWEVGGKSKQGKVLGIKDKTDPKNINKEQEDENYDYKKLSQYSSSLKKNKTEGVSDFATKLTIKEQREKLPIFKIRSEFLRLIQDWPIIVLVGETGSGKTTQITQYLYEEGYASNNMVIVCTQPRRVAAMSVAKRVSEEMNVKLGEEVGYTIRFEDCTSSKTKIKYCTDGVLLRESLNLSSLDKYSVIIMDEAHERSLNTDILFGVIKNVLAKRNDLKLIVTSATLDAKKFQVFFNNCPIFHVPGRTFKVDTNWTSKVEDDPLDAVIKCVIRIHVSSGAGDILVFMTGQEDITACCSLIAERLSKHENIEPLTILPIYSQLPADLQSKIFEKTKDGSRKCIVSTNIAETSLTVDGIKYVVDSGYCKLKTFRSNMGMDALTIVPISKANSNQRKGRAGRTNNGEVFRMYTRMQYELEMLDMTVPEIQRTNLGNVVLLLKSLGVDDLLKFDFMDPPPQSTMLEALNQLWMLNALNNSGELTQTGKQMVQFPLDPSLSKMLIYSMNMKDKNNNCSNEILTIVSMLSVPSIFFRPEEKAQESDNAREKFFIPESDHLTLLNIFQEWKRKKYNEYWCKEHFIHIKTMKKIREIRSQLVDIMINKNYKIESPKDNNWIHVRKAICSSYFCNAAKLKGIGEYINLRKGIPCYLHPSSSLFGMGYTPDYIIYHELIFTSKEYMRNVTAVNGEWLAELGPMFFYLKNENDDFYIKTKQQEKLNELIMKQDNEIHQINKKNQLLTNEQNRIKLQNALNSNVIGIGDKRLKFRAKKKIPNW